MAGLSSQAAGKLQSQHKYNGKEEQRKELSDGRGLEWTGYGARLYDQQIGRWHSEDNLSEKYISITPYNYCTNNPINFIDMDGNEFTDAAWGWVNRVIGEINQKQRKNNEDIESKMAKLGAD